MALSLPADSIESAMSERYDTPVADTVEDDCSPEAFDEVAIAFHDMVKASVDARTIEKWVGKTEVRRSLFDDMAMGRIRWPRSLGRPDTPNLSDGFVIRAKFWVDIWHIDGNGSVVVDLEGWTPGLAVDLLDNVADPDYYSVRYLFNAARQNDNRVEVSLANVPWHRPVRFDRPRQHYLSSHGFEFHSGGTFVSLPTIELADQPFFHV
jgi:hypothetical protein